MTTVRLIFSILAPFLPRSFIPNSASLDFGNFASRITRADGSVHLDDRQGVFLALSLPPHTRIRLTVDSLATIFRHLLPSGRSFRLRRRSYHPRRRTHSLVRLHHSPTSRRSSQTTRRVLRPRCRLPALRNAVSQHVHEPRGLWRMSGRGGYGRLHVGLASCGGQGSDDGVQGRAMCRYAWSVLTLVLGSQRNLTSSHYRTNVFLSRQSFSTSVKGMEGSKLKTSDKEKRCLRNEWLCRTPRPKRLFCAVLGAAPVLNRPIFFTRPSPPPSRR